jgi:hypothetical protein
MGSISDVCRFDIVLLGNEDMQLTRPAFRARDDIQARCGYGADVVDKSG